MSSDAFIPPSILLVDDEEPFVAAMAKRLKKRTLAVQTALSGSEALEKLKGGGSSNIDLVILDVKMPGMDGPGSPGKNKGRPPFGGGDHAHRPRHH